jgi:hypothetical protein
VLEQICPEVDVEKRGCNNCLLQSQSGIIHNQEVGGSSYGTLHGQCWLSGS